MKKILLLTLIASLAFGQNKISDFAKGKDIVAYVIVTNDKLDELIPAHIDYSMKYDSKGGKSQRTLREFLFQHLIWDLGDGTTLIRLACDESGKGYRYIDGTKQNDMALWNSFLSPHGYGVNTWLNHDEAMVLIGEQL